MFSITEQMNPEILDWLLEESYPTVRYLTFKLLLAESENSSKVIEAKKQIMSLGVVPKIIEKMTPDGYWDKENSFYTAKYRGTVWQLMILAEHFADYKNKNIIKSCNFLLSKSWQSLSGGFSYKNINGKPDENGIIPCLTGNMLFTYCRLAPDRNDVIRSASEWLCNYLRFDDGDTKVPNEHPWNNWNS